jgi:hypothetical protein
MEKGKTKHKTEPSKENRPNILTECGQVRGGGDTSMQLDEQDLADIELEKLEEAFNIKELQTIPVEQLKNMHKYFIYSTAGSTSRLRISLDLTTKLKLTSHEIKRKGCKSTHQLIKEVWNYMLYSGKI